MGERAQNGERSSRRQGNGDFEGYKPFSVYVFFVRPLFPVSRPHRIGLGRNPNFKDGVTYRKAGGIVMRAAVGVETPVFSGSVQVALELRCGTNMRL